MSRNKYRHVTGVDVKKTTRVIEKEIYCLDWQGAQYNYFPSRIVLEKRGGTEFLDIEFRDKDSYHFSRGILGPCEKSNVLRSSPGITPTPKTRTDLKSLRERLEEIRPKLCESLFSQLSDSVRGILELVMGERR